MPDIARHYRLLAAALPSKEKRIRTSYVPTLVLVVAASTVAFVVRDLGWFVITLNVYNVVQIHDFLHSRKTTVLLPATQKPLPSRIARRRRLYCKYFPDAAAAHSMDMLHHCRW